jgi:antagonist of KipI
MSLLVVKPGLLATVQDRGRPGWGRFGVSPSGALDPFAAFAANRLAGNPPEAALLELTGPGAVLRAESAMTVALAGGDLGAEILPPPGDANTASTRSAPLGSATPGEPLEPFSSARLAVGATLFFRERRRGARAYLAVTGGLEVERVFGSAATDLSSQLGPRPLAAGQRLAVGPHARSIEARAAAALAAWYDDGATLRVVAASTATEAAIAALTSGSYKVSSRANRAGYFLEGPSLPLVGAEDAISEPIAPGAIQVPPHGQPILLLADRQTVGGYPVVGHLAAADTPKAAQLWPGDSLRFTTVSLEAAQSLLRTQYADLGRL